MNMKVIPKNDLICLIQRYCNDHISVDSMMALFNTYGDEYRAFVNSEKYELYAENEQRKKLIGP